MYVFIYFKWPKRDAVSITARRDKKKKRKRTIGRSVVVTTAASRETYLLCEGVMVLEGFAD